MFDLKVMNSVLSELEEERGIPRAKVIEAIEAAMATAYKKEYAKKGQIIRARIDLNAGTTEFQQIKTVVDDSTVRFEDEATSTINTTDNENNEPKLDAEGNPIAPLPYYNEEQHIKIEDAKFIKRDASVGDELVFPLEAEERYGRIAAQTAKQVIIQKIREAEKVSVVAEYGARQGEIVSGTVQRMERGNIYVDLGRATGILPYDEQIPGERYRQGERIRGLLYQVEESPRGIYLRLSRAKPEFLVKLFEMEAPEAAAKTVVFKAIAREAGSRTKVGVASNEEGIDPVGSCVGQKGTRVTTVTNELGEEEKIDIILWSDDPIAFISHALAPAKVEEVEMKATKEVRVLVAADQLSLAIGKGGQNVRLAAKLTGWHIEIRSITKPDESIEGAQSTPPTESTEPNEPPETQDGTTEVS